MPPTVPPTVPARTPDLRVLPAPESNPPYDDEARPAVPTRSVTPTAPDPAQGTLTLSFRLSSGVHASPRPPSALRPIERSAHGQAPEPDSQRPAARMWACRFVQALVEVLSGTRPATQLVSWTSAEVYDRVKRRAAVPGGWPPHGGRLGRPAVHSVRLCRPQVCAAEVCAVVHAGGRARAMALRLEGDGPRWRCTELELG